MPLSYCKSPIQLLSRKILATEKFSDFHTVRTEIKWHTLTNSANKLQKKMGDGGSTEVVLGQT